MSEQPHYGRRSAEVAADAARAADEARARRSRRDLIAGPLWIGFGVVATLISLNSGGTIIFVVWGPVLYGAYLIWRGLRHRD